MISIFDLVRKSKNELLDREKLKLDKNTDDENAEKNVKTRP